MKGNHKNPQPHNPVYNRKVARNKLKSANGNNKIKTAWRRLQIKKFGGLVAYVRMRMFKTPQSQHNALSGELNSTGR